MGSFGLAAREAKGEQGVYIYGGVGSGKTMLMDLFFNVCGEKAKLRVHYNAFMLSIHSRKTTPAIIQF